MKIFCYFPYQHVHMYMHFCLLSTHKWTFSSLKTHLLENSSQGENIQRLCLQYWRVGRENRFFGLWWQIVCHYLLCLTSEWGPLSPLFPRGDIMPVLTWLTGLVTCLHIISYFSTIVRNCGVKIYLIYLIYLKQCLWEFVFVFWEQTREDPHFFKNARVCVDTW